MDKLWRCKTAAGFLMGEGNIYVFNSNDAIVCQIPIGHDIEESLTLAERIVSDHNNALSMKQNSTNGFIDYKKWYEMAKEENIRLSKEVSQKCDEILSRTKEINLLREEIARRKALTELRKPWQFNRGGNASTNRDYRCRSYFVGNLRNIGGKMIKQSEVDIIQKKIIAEYNRSVRIHGGFNSLHEGYAVILEELDEYWEELKKKGAQKDKLEDEMVQIAAMALKTLLFLRQKP